MSSGNEPSPVVGSEEERDVVEYLRANPELLARHPELVARLSVPHECGQAVSLVEHQIGVLREQNRDLRRRIRELVTNARDNEELGTRIHRLTLELIQCQGAADVFAIVYQSLREHFGADFVAIRLYAAPRHGPDAALAEFADGAEAPDELAAALAGDKPICGRLRRDQSRSLFPDGADDVGSGALIPLGVSRPFGLLAVASRDAGRYHPGMGTVFLRQLGEVVSRLLAPHVAGP